MKHIPLIVFAIAMAVVVLAATVIDPAPPGECQAPKYSHVEDCKRTP